MDATVLGPRVRLSLRDRPPEDLLLPDVVLFDPVAGLDRRGSLLVRAGRIAALGDAGSAPEGVSPDTVVAGGLEGCYAFPGFVDAHTHARIPGQEYKEDLASASRAAVAGGFVALVAMANTHPPVDSGPLVTWVLDEAARASDVGVAQVCAVSRSLGGEELADLREAVEAGAVAFSDDGRPLGDAALLLTALRYVASVGRPVLLHLEDRGLAADGVMHEGAWSARLGLRGIPVAAESGPLARDLEVLRTVVGERAARRPAPIEPPTPLLHVQHVSTAAAVRLIREARAWGAPITAEVTPHHLLLEDSALAGFEPSLKVNPPLRGFEDRRALVEALRDGAIDCVATDHAPHAPHEKEVPFEEAPFGTVGLETAFAALYGGLVVSGEIGLGRLIEALNAAPCRILGLERPRLEIGARADLCVVDPAERWTVTAADLAGKSRNSAFLGRPVQGRVLMTIVAGARRHERLRAEGSAGV